MWPCAGKTAEARNLHLDLRGFTLTVRTPQCATLFGEQKHLFHTLYPAFGSAVAGFAAGVEVAGAGAVEETAAGACK